MAHKKGDIPLKDRIYALYQGEQNLMDGTLEEICAKRGIKFSTANFMLSPSYAKRIKIRNHYSKTEILELVRIDNLNENELEADMFLADDFDNNTGI